MCVGARCSSVVYRDVVIPCVPADGNNKSRERRRERGKCFVYGFIASQGGFTILRLGPDVACFCLLVSSVWLHDRSSEACQLVFDAHVSCDVCGLSAMSAIKAGAGPPVTGCRGWSVLSALKAGAGPPATGCRGWFSNVSRVCIVCSLSGVASAQACLEAGTLMM